LKRRNWSKSLVRIAPMPFVGGHMGSFFFLLLAAVAMVFSAVNPGGVSSLRAGFMDVAAPILSIITKPAQDAAGFVRGVSGIAQLQAENAKLINENARLREWHQAALTLHAENESLRNLLNVKVDPQNRFVSARVMGDSGNTFVKSLIVSAGRDSGVDKGQAVISGVGLIGRVIESGTNTARVLLVTDINSRVPVLIENISQHAIMAGDNEMRPTLVHLPVDSAIEPGTRVITSGQGGIFPAGIPVGVVVRDENSYRVELFADFDRLVHVRVVEIPSDPNLQESSSGLE
jgi:rod shape-determining protein MreC